MQKIGVLSRYDLEQEIREHENYDINKYELISKQNDSTYKQDLYCPTV